MTDCHASCTDMDGNVVYCCKPGGHEGAHVDEHTEQLLRERKALEVAQAALDDVAQQALQALDAVRRVVKGDGK